MAISGLPNTTAIESDALPQLARSPSSLCPRPATAPTGSPPGQMAISGLPSLAAARSDASLRLARSLSFLSPHPTPIPGVSPLGQMVISGLPSRAATRSDASLQQARSPSSSYQRAAIPEGLLPDQMAISGLPSQTRLGASLLMGRSSCSRCPHLEGSLGRLPQGQMGASGLLKYLLTRLGASPLERKEDGV